MGKIKNKVKSFKDGIISRLYHDMKWIYGFYRNYIGRILGYIAVEILHMAVSFYITYKMGPFVDIIIEMDTEKTLAMGLEFIGLFLLVVILNLTSNRFGSWNYNSMRSDLVKKLYNKLMHSDWEELTSYHTGDLITRLSNDAMTIAGNANGFLTTLISCTLMIIVSVSVIIINDVSMILVVIIVAPLIAVSSRIFMKKVYECQTAIKAIESKENSYHKESFHNIQSVKAFGLADVFYKRIEALEKERYTADMRSNFFSLLSWAVTFLAGIISGVICIGWALYRVNSGAISIGGLTVVIAMAYRTAMAGKELLGLIPISLQLAVSTERVCELLNIKDEKTVESPAFNRLVDKSKGRGIAVKVNEMSFAYKTSRQIFDKVSMEAHPGEIIALVGPSGEGKTTMLRILLGILNIQQGEAYAYIEGNDKERIVLSTETRPLIAYVPQGNTMLAGTIAENMRLIAPDATDEEIIDSLNQSCAYDFVKKLPKGIYHNIGESGIGFSEGQNQRLAIARAILRKTPILLMDEATSALDVVTERQVLSNIMKKDTRRTCILTTHRPSVLSVCDRVYRISDGKVAVIGDIEIRKLMNEF
ncbi:ABC transporter ATP-binding protein [Butyrivibrio sp. FCS006]|uniref:ABC transporter ATP-binding protein n=1 Tax=Butyrivibrio sp. FCS006 TaxID=1280684 RepID=UPI00041B6496|nr:ABC transporter ATP-binding protein [Butyrivibrio sp. FCS006]